MSEVKHACRWTGGYTTAIWIVRLRIVSGIDSCDVSVRLSACLFVCPHATNRAPLPRFIVKFCTWSLLTHPKFVFKWTTVLLLLKCANFDIEQQQRTVLLSLCVQCHTGAVLVVRTLPKYFSERRLFETQKLLGDSDRRVPTQLVFPCVITGFEITTLPKSSGHYMYHQV